MRVGPNHRSRMETGGQGKSCVRDGRTAGLVPEQPLDAQCKWQLPDLGTYGECHCGSTSTSIGYNLDNNSNGSASDETDVLFGWWNGDVEDNCHKYEYEDSVRGEDVQMVRF